MSADVLPSWNDGNAKQAILAFVKQTTTPGGPKFIEPANRIAAFDQDGTTWVEQPAYTQVLFAFDQLAAMAGEGSTAQGDRALQDRAFRRQCGYRQTGGTRTFQGRNPYPFRHDRRGIPKVRQDWITTAKHPRYQRLYTDLVYLPMLELMQYLRANGYKTIIVTGGGQDFVRTYAERIYGIPRHQVVGSAAGTTLGYDAGGRAILTKDPKLLWVNDKSGKPVEIHQAIGRRPVMAFGNSDGDQQMLEYTQGGEGARFMMLVHHDDAAREYATDAAMSVFSEALMAQAKRSGWHVVSMKKDWNRIFAWQSRGTITA